MAIQKISNAVIADNAIDSDNIPDGEITTAKIGDDQITNAKIAPDAVTSTEIANGSVTYDQIANGTIITSNIADGQITSAKMASNITLNASDYILDGISTNITDTAVDVFIYDTSKDSDGGAWRERTQDTSWYNETLNTSTRGSRKEFPAVAVIVAESRQVAIYDGDDPDMPMWMVFDGGGGGMANRFMVQSTGDLSCVAMLNGILIPGRSNDSSSYGIPIINFISEKVVRMDSQAESGEGGTYTGNIATRNDIAYGYVSSSEDYDIISSGINDIAMTVLPNAQIDAATGLPVPTIAVATDGGISVIKDDGTVVDINPDTGGQYAPIARVEFIGTTEIAYASRNTAVWYLSPIPSSDTTYSAYNDKTGNVDRVIYGGFYSSPEIVITDDNDSGYSDREIATQNREEINFQTRRGLNKVYRDTADESKGLSAVIKHDYNTGWMNGDIKLATLSDTDDTDVTGSELVTNGTFDTDLSSWVVTGSGTVTHESGGFAKATVSGATNIFLYQAFSVTAGKTYMITATANIGDTDTTNPWIRVGTTPTSYNRGSLKPFSTSIESCRRSFTWYASTTETVYLNFTNSNAIDGRFFTLDDVTVQEVEEDRSVNGNGLQVFGTVTKNPVATGADLVAYSGFSSSNYLQQPYNSDLNFSSGDYSYMGWAKTPYSADYKLIIGRGGNGVYGPGALSVSLVQPNNTLVYVCSSDWNETTGGGSWGTRLESGAVPNDIWFFFTITHSGSTARMYINGVEVDEDTSAVNPKAPTTNFLETMIGAEMHTVNRSIGRPFGGDLALIRASATAPSPEQIKKIYDDEKVLFQENAKATLYGSSDAVTALAYDDNTELLHVGTSAGRSVFQELRRIDNTTDAVSTAISANNGMVAEQ